MWFFACSVDFETSKWLTHGNIASKIYSKIRHSCLHEMVSIWVCLSVESVQMTFLTSAVKVSIKHQVDKNFNRQPTNER